VGQPDTPGAIGQHWQIDSTDTGKWDISAGENIDYGNGDARRKKREGEMHAALIGGRCTACNASSGLLERQFCRSRDPISKKMHPHQRAPQFPEHIASKGQFFILVVY